MAEAKDKQDDGQAGETSTVEADKPKAKRGRPPKVKNPHKVLARVKPYLVVDGGDRSSNADPYGKVMEHNPQVQGWTIIQKAGPITHFTRSVARVKNGRRFISTEQIEATPENCKMLEDLFDQKWPNPDTHDENPFQTGIVRFERMDGRERIEGPIKHKRQIQK